MKTLKRIGWRFVRLIMYLTEGLWWRKLISWRFFHAAGKLYVLYIGKVYTPSPEDIWGKDIWEQIAKS